MERGASLSVALEQHPKVFNTLFVSMVQAGEAAGVLDETLERIADTLEAAAALQRQDQVSNGLPDCGAEHGCGRCGAHALVRGAPVRRHVCRRGRRPSQLLPECLIIGSNILTGYWYIIFPAFGAAVYGFRVWINTVPGRRVWDAFKLGRPSLAR